MSKYANTANLIWTDERCREALREFPPGRFRALDAYDVAERLLNNRPAGYGLWVALQRCGLIVKTGTLIGQSKRHFYWERTPGSEQPAPTTEPGSVS